MIQQDWLFPKSRKTKVAETGCGACGNVYKKLFVSHLHIYKEGKVSWESFFEVGVNNLLCPNCQNPQGFAASSLLVIPYLKLKVYYVPPECLVSLQTHAVDTLESLLKKKEKSEYQDFKRKLVTTKFEIASLAACPSSIIEKVHNPFSPTFKRAEMHPQKAFKSLLADIDESLKTLEECKLDPSIFLPWLVTLNRYERTKSCQELYNSYISDLNGDDATLYSKWHGTLLSFTQVYDANFNYQDTEISIRPEVFDDFDFTAKDFKDDPNLLRKWVQTFVDEGLYGKAFDLCYFRIKDAPNNHEVIDYFPDFLSFGTLISISKESKIGSGAYYFLIIISTLLSAYDDIEQMPDGEKVLLSNAYGGIATAFGHHSLWLGFCDNLIRSANVDFMIGDLERAAEKAYKVGHYATTINSTRFIDEANQLLSKLRHKPTNKKVKTRPAPNSSQMKNRVNLIFELKNDPLNEIKPAYSPEYRISANSMKHAEIKLDGPNDLFRYDDSVFHALLPWPSPKSEEILTEMIKASDIRTVTIRPMQKHYDPDYTELMDEFIFDEKAAKSSNFIQRIKEGATQSKDEWFPLIDFAVYELRHVWLVNRYFSHKDKVLKNEEIELSDSEKFKCIEALAAIAGLPKVPPGDQNLIATELNELTTKFEKKGSQLSPSGNNVIANGKAVANELLGEYEQAYKGYMSALGPVLTNKVLEQSIITNESFKLLTSQVNRALRCLGKGKVHADTFTNYQQVFHSVELIRNAGTRASYIRKTSIEKMEVSPSQKSDINLKANELYIQLNLVQQFGKDDGCWHYSEINSDSAMTFDRMTWNIPYQFYDELLKNYTNPSFLNDGESDNIDDLMSASSRTLNWFFKNQKHNDAVDCFLINTQSYAANIPWGFLAAVSDEKKKRTAVQCFSYSTFQTAQQREVIATPSKVREAALFVDPHLKNIDLPECVEKERASFTSDAFIASLKSNSLTVYLGHGSILLDDESSLLQFSENDVLDSTELSIDTNGEFKVAIIFGCWAGASSMSSSVATMTSLGIPSRLKANGVDFTIASPWPVSIEIASEFIKHFLEQRESAVRVVEAFKATQHHLIEKFGIEKYLSEGAGIQLYA